MEKTGVIKVLFISNIANKVGSFSVASIAAARRNGLEFYYAANWSNATYEQRLADEKKYGINLVHIDLERSPYSIKNYKAYKQLVNFINKEKIDYIHCNTPVGGMLGRLAGKKCKVKKVIYQVHGFHFYEGAPKKNWLIYYPIEKYLAKLTDAIITINKDDYKYAKSFDLRNNGSAYYVPGVGIDLAGYSDDSLLRKKMRQELQLKSSDYAIISVGELNDNKNNKVIIKAIAKLKKLSIHYYLCGLGACEDDLKRLATELNVINQVHFLGYRTDVVDVLQAFDAFVLPSYREGLSRSLMEAMASGLPCIVSDIRGNSDLINNGIGGYLVKPDDVNGFSAAISSIMESPVLRLEMKENNLAKIKNYSLEVVIDKLSDIYSSEFRE